MLNGGWLSKRIAHGNLLLSLNTLYFAYGPDCNVTGPPLEQLEWLGALLQNAVTAEQRVIISGHIPPGKCDGSVIAFFLLTFFVADLWLPRCRFGIFVLCSFAPSHSLLFSRAWYAQLCVANARTIRGQIFGHKHSDQFNFINTDGVVNSPNLSPSVSIAVNCAPSIVPTFNPSYRVWSYDPSSLDLGGYDQFYADLDALYKGEFRFEKEYNLLDAYNMQGNPSNVEFWIRLDSMLKANLTLSLQYLKFKFVSVANPPMSEICKRINC